MAAARFARVQLLWKPQQKRLLRRLTLNESIKKVEKCPVVVFLLHSKYTSLDQDLLDTVSTRNFALVKFGSEMAEKRRHEVKGLLVYGTQQYVAGSCMDLFPNLRVISSFGVGYDRIDVVEATRRGIRVGNTPNCLNDCTADFGFALLLASARNVVEGEKIAKDPGTTKLPTNLLGAKVSGASLGIVGMGRVGSKVAERARGFSMRVFYHNRNRKDPSEGHGAEYCSNLDDLLKQSDFVMVVLPSTPQTIGMFSAHQFSLMKPTATFINISRGNIVNQEDLVDALQSGTIRGAALDVTDPEPLPRDHPLLKLPNTIITPHIAYLTMETRKAMFEMVLDNLEAGLQGHNLPYGVN